MNYICGIDEAGRGCIAGSLFVAGVLTKIPTKNILNPLEKLQDLKDSKQLSENKINELFGKIQNISDLSFIVVKCNNKMIDLYGLSYCMKYTLETIKKRVFIKLGNLRYKQNLKTNLIYKDIYESKKVRFILDGNTSYKVKNIATLIGGDKLNINISAASIVAKFNKNFESIELHKLYPEYNFAKNKGYGSKSHINTIKNIGYSPVHRKSFKINI